MRWQQEPKAGDKCSCCKRLKLRLVNGAVVCTVCDHVNEWKRGY